MEEIGDLSEFEKAGSFESARCLHKCVVLEKELEEGHILILGGSEKKFVEKLDLKSGEVVEEDLSKIEKVFREVAKNRKVLKQSSVA